MSSSNYFSKYIGSSGLINNQLSSVASIKGGPKNLKSSICHGLNMQLLGSSVNKIITGGLGFDTKEVETIAVAEFIERYISSSPRYDLLIKASYSELKNKFNVLNPSSYIPFKDSQYKNFPKDDTYKIQEYGENDKIHWIIGKDINDTEIYVPAFLVYWVFINRDEKLYTIPTTTGIATGRDSKHAISSAFLENCERSAFSSFWFLQNENKNFIYNKELISKTYPNSAKLKNLLDTKLDVNVFDLKEHGVVETMVAFVTCEIFGESVFGVGAASRFNKHDAIVKAITEAYQCLNLARHQLVTKDWSNDFNFSKQNLINDYEDHFFYYNRYPKLKKEVPIFQDLKNLIREKKINDDNSKMKSFTKEELLKFNLEDTIIIDFKNEIIPKFPVFKILNPKLKHLSGSFNYSFIGYKEFENKNLFLDHPHFFP